MNLGKRIGVAFELAGVRAPAVARATGVPVTSINALLRRGSKRSEFTEQILSFLPAHKVNHEWVRTGLGSPEPTLRTNGLDDDWVRKSAPNQEEGRTGQGREETRGGAAPIARSIQSNGNQALAAAPLRSWEQQDALPLDSGWVLVPKLGIVPSTSAAGKEEIKTVLLVDEVQALRAEWIREDRLRPAALAWSIASDGSMEDVISRGDSYITDTSDTKVTDGKTYAIWYGNAQHARKLFQLPGGGLRIKPRSDEFATVDLTAEQAKELRIIGRIVHRAGRGGL